MISRKQLELLGTAETEHEGFDKFYSREKKKRLGTNFIMYQ